MDSLSQIIYKGLQTLNGDNTNSLYKNKHDAIDKMLTSTTSTESLRAKVERWLVNEETEGDSLEARLNYWLRQRVDYEDGDSLNRLLEKYFVLNNLVNSEAIQHLTYFTDTEWVDIINGYDAQLVSSNAFQSNGIDNNIDTSTAVKENTKIKMLFRLVSQSGTDLFFGARANEPRHYFGVDSSGAWVYGYNDQRTTFGSSDNEWHVVEHSIDGLWIDGIKEVDGIAEYYDGSESIKIFTAGASVLRSNIEIGYFEIYEGNILIKHIIASAGIGDQLYDTDGNGYQIEGTINEETQWVTQDSYHYNLLNGFDLYEDTSRNRLRVPIGSTVSDTSFAFVETFRRSGYIPAETKFKQPDIQALKDADDGQFFTGGIANELSFDEIINATANLEVIGIESTVCTDGQAQMISEGLTVSYQEYSADVPNGGTLVFSSISGDDYYDSLNGVIVSGTGSDVTLTNNTGDTADMGVIHMTGKIESATVVQMASISATMLGNTALQSCKNPIWLATGKNLFDGELEYGKINFTTGELEPSAVDIRGVNTLNVTGGQDLIISGDVVGPTAIFEYDAGMTLIKYTIVSQTKVTLDSSTRFVRFFGNEVRFPDLLDTKVQAKYESVATAYEAYKSSQMTILQNGGADLEQGFVPAVADYTDIFGKNHQNTKEYVLQASDIVELNISLPNNDRARTSTTFFQDAITWENTIEGKVLVSNFLESSATTDTIADNFTFATQADGKLAFKVPKGTYASLPDAQADLAGTVIRYQLATPIITDAQITIVDENGISQDYWKLFANGQISGTASELMPIGQIVNLQNGENIFARTHPTKSGVIVYSKPISGLDQDYARAFVGRPLAEKFRLLDSEGDYLFDSNNDALYVTGV